MKKVVTVVLLICSFFMFGCAVDTQHVRIASQKGDKIIPISYHIVVPKE